MKDIAFALGQNKSNLLLVLASRKSGKPVISCYISKELVAERNLNAAEIVKTLGKHIQGGGGGQPFYATAGGKNLEGLAAALAEAENLLK